MRKNFSFIICCFNPMNLINLLLILTKNGTTTIRKKKRGQRDYGKDVVSPLWFQLLMFLWILRRFPWRLLYAIAVGEKIVCHCDDDLIVQKFIIIVDSLEINHVRTLRFNLKFVLREHKLAIWVVVENLKFRSAIYRKTKNVSFSIQMFLNWKMNKVDSVKQMISKISVSTLSLCFNIKAFETSPLFWYYSLFRLLYLWQLHFLNQVLCFSRQSAFHKIYVKAHLSKVVSELLNIIFVQTVSSS